MLHAGARAAPARLDGPQIDRFKASLQPPCLYTSSTHQLLPHPTPSAACGWRHAGAERSAEPERGEPRRRRPRPTTQHMR